MPREDAETQVSEKKEDKPKDPNLGASRGVGVFACACGFRGKESELKDKKCPRCGSSVEETTSPALRIKAYEKFDGLSYEDHQAKQEKDKQKNKAASA